MQRIVSLLLALAVLASGCGEDGPIEGALEAVGLSENVDVQAPPPAATADDVIEQLAADGFNGVVLIDQPSGLQLRPLGSADGPDGPPIDEDTVFDIGSITKQFTGAAILRLQMDGLLSVDDALGVHLAEVKGPLGEVTLHELLTHTAGLPDGIGDDYEPIDREMFIDRATTQIHPTGAFAYSNVGYSLLGMVIESVSGMGYEAHLREVFFEPLGMDATGYVLPDYPTMTVAAGYLGDERLGLPNEQEWADDGPWWNLRANGGLLSTASDMRRWSRALDGDAVLDAASRELLFARHVEEGEGAGSFYGYGWVSFPDGNGGWFHGHNGGNGVFFADLLRLPDGTTIFIATNTSGADEDAAFRIAETLIEGGVGAACLPPIDVEAHPVVDDLPDTTAGRAIGAMIDIVLDGDDGDRQAFVERHVSESLAQGLSVQEQVAELALLQEEFVGYTVDMIRLEDERRAHVALTSADAPPLVLSVTVDADDPDRVACVHIEAP